MTAGGLTIRGATGAEEGKRTIFVDTVDMGQKVLYNQTVALGLECEIILRFRPGCCIETS